MRLGKRNSEADSFRSAIQACTASRVCSVTSKRFEANWLGGSLAWRPADGVKLKIGYRRNRFRAGDDWANHNVLVTGINVFF